MQRHGGYQLSASLETTPESAVHLRDTAVVPGDPARAVRILSGQDIKAQVVDVPILWVLHQVIQIRGQELKAISSWSRTIRVVEAVNLHVIRQCKAIPLSVKAIDPQGFLKSKKLNAGQPVHGSETRIPFPCSRPKYSVALLLTRAPPCPCGQLFPPGMREKTAPLGDRQAQARCSSRVECVDCTKHHLMSVSRRGPHIAQCILGRLGERLDMPRCTLEGPRKGTYRLGVQQ